MHRGNLVPPAGAVPDWPELRPIPRRLHTGQQRRQGIVRIPRRIRDSGTGKHLAIGALCPHTGACAKFLDRAAQDPAVPLEDSCL